MGLNYFWRSIFLMGVQISNWASFRNKVHSQDQLYLVFPVIVLVISAMFTFQFCPKLKDKHCREHYDYDKENKIQFPFFDLVSHLVSTKIVTKLHNVTKPFSIKLATFPPKAQPDKDTVQSRVLMRVTNQKINFFSKGHCT